MQETGSKLGKGERGAYFSKRTCADKHLGTCVTSAGAAKLKKVGREDLFHIGVIIPRFGLPKTFFQSVYFSQKFVIDMARCCVFFHSRKFVQPEFGLSPLPIPLPFPFPFWPG